MKKIKTKKLTLHRETLCQLDADAMKDVKGGLIPLFTYFSDCYPC
jgi:hypothetical protein